MPCLTQASRSIHCSQCEKSRVLSKKLWSIKNFSCELTIVISLLHCFLSFSMICRRILKALGNDTIFHRRINPKISKSSLGQYSLTENIANKIKKTWKITTETMSIPVATITMTVTSITFPSTMNALIFLSFLWLIINEWESYCRTLTAQICERLSNILGNSCYPLDCTSQ